MDKTLLVLGAGLDQIPGLVKAKQMGLRVIALDGNPKAPGRYEADSFYTVSIKHAEQVEHFIHKQLREKVDGVISFGVDIPSIISRTADLLGVNYTIPFQSAQVSENKLLAKDMMKGHVNIPPYAELQNYNDALSFFSEEATPIIIKPVDNSASRGISIVFEKDSIENAIDVAYQHSPSQTIMAEKFLSGPQISVESLVIDGEFFHIGFADRNYQDMEKFYPNIIENGGDLPSIHITKDQISTLTKCYHYICNTLNIKNGVIKGDIVIHNNEIHIIEFALRLSGGHFSSTEIPESTGVDFLQSAIKLHIDEPVNTIDLQQTKNIPICLRYAFMEDFKAGIIQHIKSPTSLEENILLHTMYVQPGDSIHGQTTNHALRVACVITRGCNRAKARENAETFLEQISISV